MQLSVQMEKTSPILRKLTIKVPAAEVNSRFERGLQEVQKTARLKGFRPGNVPISVVKQYYGEDVRHRVYHHLIDEAFETAVREQKIRAVGAPKVEAPDHQTGKGDHDHGIQEDKDFTFTATVEIMPDIEVKNYSGLALKRENAEIKDGDVDKIVEALIDSQAELVPVGGGLALADGSMTSRPAQKKDYADIAFDGGLVTDSGVERKEGMKGSRVIELGSDSLIPGFEENIEGMRRGESKTFRLKFPADYHEADMSGKEAEFSVTLNELKEKKVPELNDELAKTMGYESVADFRKKAHTHLIAERTREVDQKLQSDLLGQLIEKNPFDVPATLIEGQTRALAQEWGQELKRQGLPDEAIQQAIMGEIENLKKRAETQVRASLILEAIAKKETIEVRPEDLEDEYKTMAASMKVEEGKVREFYQKNQGRRDDLEFRMRQERTVKFLLDKAKIKSAS
jgi:trigger factor